MDFILVKSKDVDYIYKITVHGVRLFHFHTSQGSSGRPMMGYHSSAEVGIFYKRSVYNLLQILPTSVIRQKRLTEGQF